MIISQIKIDFITPKNGLIAFASLIIDNNLFLSSIGIHERLNGGYRLTYPNKGEFTLFNPINKNASETIEKAIFEHLKNVMSGDNHNGQHS